MRDLRRNSGWVTDVRSRIGELRRSGNARWAWRGHQLDLLLGAYVKSLEMADACLGKLDVAAREGSLLPPRQIQVRDLTRKDRHMKRMNRQCLDRDVISRIPAQTRSCQAASAPGPCTQGWAWTYLIAVLATALGYDEAREVVNQVQRMILDEGDCDVSRELGRTARL